MTLNNISRFPFLSCERVLFSTAGTLETPTDSCLKKSPARSSALACTLNRTRIRETTAVAMTTGDQTGVLNGRNRTGAVHYSIAADGALRSLSIPMTRQ